MKLQGRCCKRLAHIQLGISTLAVRGPAERLARFYGEYVDQKDRTHDESQDCHPNLPHIRITPFRKGVANRRFCNSAEIILSSRA